MDIGRTPSQRPTASRGVRSPIPATIAHAAPTVGRSAAQPGNGVEAEKTTAATAIAAIPAQPSTTLAAAGSRASFAAATARVAPRPSSQARANGE